MAAEDLQKLTTLEAEHAQKLRTEMGPALTGFLDTYAPMLPFKAAEKVVANGLPKDLEDRVAAVARFAGCEASGVV